MKIAWIRIKGFQQFEDTFLDFRHPDTGKALDKICLIGRNGTGKSTILQLINTILKFYFDGYYNIAVSEDMPEAVLMKIEEAGEDYYVIVLKGQMNGGSIFFVKNVYSHLTPWDELLKEINTQINLGPSLILKQRLFDVNPSHVQIYCPSEAVNNFLVELSNVPKTDLSSALNLLKTFPIYHLVSNETISDFWKLLIYRIKKRENDREEFEKAPNNINKTKKALIAEFDEKNPDILTVIGDLWNEILGKAGLKFDYENAKKPIQLTENLHAYIINKNGTRVNYNKLSTGIRNFIFRFGHIKTLYFNREIKRGLLLVDEPENSLFPDFLLNIIEQYEKVTTDKNGERNTQMFFATHSPIIAAQFEPYERIILEWNENGSVAAKKGISPVGDDPNDILYQDFGMTEIVSKKGQEVWQHYLELKKMLNREKDEVKKEKLVEEILKIGREYKF